MLAKDRSPVFSFSVKSPDVHQCSTAYCGKVGARGNIALLGIGNSCCDHRTAIARDEVRLEFRQIVLAFSGVRHWRGRPRLKMLPSLSFNRPFPIYACSVHQTSSDLGHDKPANCSSNRCNAFCDVAYLIGESLIPQASQKEVSQFLKPTLSTVHVWIVDFLIECVLHATIEG
jgi:hypothetical protein